MMEKTKRYLFICAYAQSRSKYFAEELMKKGYMCQFCGFAIGADFTLTEKHIEWADVIIVLAGEIVYDSAHKFLTSCKKVYPEKQFVTYYIRDEPVKFKKQLKDLVTII
jgi:predicted protein tyrosine phosphatase